MLAFWWKKQKEGGSGPDPAPHAAEPATTHAAGSENPAGGDCEPHGYDAGLHTEVDAEKCGKQCARQDGERFRYFMYGARPEPMPSHLGPLEKPCEGRIGIACSGGGIRSAAFNLGALQSLQKDGKLTSAHYLAAVSGGSYIAAAFSMVAKRWTKESPKPPEAAAGAEAAAGTEAGATAEGAGAEKKSTRPAPGKPGHDDSNPDALAHTPPFAPGSPEEQYLRNRSSYMAPSGSDKLFLAFRVVLALLFNLIFLALPLIGIGLLLGATLFRWEADCTKDPCEVLIPPGFWIPIAVLGGLALLLGLLGLVRRLNNDKTRAFFQAWSTRFLVSAAVVAVVLVALPATADLFIGNGHDREGVEPDSTSVFSGLGGFLGLIAGIGAYARQIFSAPKEAAEKAGAVRKTFAGLNEKVRVALMYAAGAVLGPLLLFSAFALAVAVALANSHGGLEDWVWQAGVGVLVFFVWVYSFADITSTSLHPYYKRRLSSAFALKRIRDGDFTDAERKRVQLVPPVEDPVKDVGAAIERDFDELVPLSQTCLNPSEGEWPTLIVCAAANVSDPGATPPGRSVTSFTFSAYSVGGPLIGAAVTSQYEGAVGAAKPALWRRGWAFVRGKPQPTSTRRARDLTLPAAVAMAGAALSPTMGKMTKRPLTFLLALANVRLGVWVPNPRWVMRASERKRGLFGRPRPWYLIEELLGRNRVNAKYLYVTDGGHYENLGLVELLRRGCTRIYCFDASNSKTAFKDLGEAIALARNELGVAIHIDPRPLKPDEKTGFAETDTVLGTFTYRKKPGDKGDPITGTLIYAHNVLTKPPDPTEPPQPPADDDDPWDVYAYQEVDPKFPHNSTVDQLYTDQKFEGYRVLGEVAGKRAIELMQQKHPGA